MNLLIHPPDLEFLAQMVYFEHFRANRACSCALGNPPGRTRGLFVPLPRGSLSQCSGNANTREMHCKLQSSTCVANKAGHKGATSQARCWLFTALALPLCFETYSISPSPKVHKLTSHCYTLFSYKNNQASCHSRYSLL